MTIHTIEYRGYSLRAYTQQIFPPHGDPFAKGPKRFSAIVQIDAIPADGVTAKRYSPAIKGSEPESADDAIGIAVQYGKDIIDGKVQAGALYNARSGRVSGSVRRFRQQSQPLGAGNMTDSGA
jgi:hypothetical protein